MSSDRAVDMPVFYLPEFPAKITEENSLCDCLPVCSVRKCVCLTIFSETSAPNFMWKFDGTGEKKKKEKENAILLVQVICCCLLSSRVIGLLAGILP